jgi:hypothetical protein
MAIHPVGCHCDGCQGYDTPTGSPDKPAADPAQSAPSAGPLTNDYTQLVKPAVSVPSSEAKNADDFLLAFSEENKWPVFIENPEDAYRILEAMEAYAALRTAQLERELAEERRRIVMWVDGNIKLLTRAETAESALRDAKKL